VYAVALAELAGDLEEEAVALAPVLGVAPYDIRVRFAGVLPRVVFNSPSRSEAERVLGLLRARGHGALVCDTRDVPSGSGMIRIHRFAFAPDALLANDGGPRLPYDEVAAILVARIRTDVVRKTEDVVLVPQPKGPPITAVVEHDRNEHVLDHAAYVFPRAPADGPLATAWVLRESDAQYRALGDAMSIVRHENFLTTLAILRARAPGAIYDDRFAAAPIGGANVLHARGHASPEAPAQDARADLAVHLLARWVLREGRAEPYR
jgi:hypothetical protein